MKILILSDLHANLEALTAIREAYDELWVLGDLVDYGPDPTAVIDFVRSHASLVVRGNHDQAVGCGVDPQCSPRFRRMAEETQRYTMVVLDEQRKRYLRELPLTTIREVAGVRFHLSHSLPSDPLYPYCGPDSDRWLREASHLDAEILLTGHTHVPFMREAAGRMIVNPGSVGQPKHGLPRASYAVYEDGRIELRSATYEPETTVRKLLALPLSLEVREQLAEVLRTGRIPSESGATRVI